MFLKNSTIQKIISAICLLLMLIATDRILTYLLEPMSRADFYLSDIREMKKRACAGSLSALKKVHLLPFWEETDQERAVSRSI